MPDEAHEQARQRSARRCGYCGVSEADAGATLTIDHHRPRVHGGRDSADNLIYCCPRCNEHKGSYWHETDPPHIPLLHPLRDNLTGHVAEGEDGRLIGLTPEGTFFAQRLRLNRPQLVAYRLRRRADAELREEVEALRRRVRELEQSIVDLQGELTSVEAEIERDVQ